MDDKEHWPGQAQLNVAAKQHHAAGRREVLDGMETVIAASRETYQLSPKLSFSEKHLVAGVFETMGVCIAMLRTQLDKDGEG